MSVIRRRIDLVKRVSVLVHRLIDTRYSVATSEDLRELEVLEELIARDVDDYMARRYANRYQEPDLEPDINGLSGRWQTQRQKSATRSR